MSKQYQKQKSKSKQQGRKELAKEILDTIEKRKDKSETGTLTKIYSYCKKIYINTETKQNGKIGK